MHYANCATFNADFDGDEINLHLPQARAPKLAPGTQALLALRSLPPAKHRLACFPLLLPQPSEQQFSCCGYRISGCTSVPRTLI